MSSKLNGLMSSESLFSSTLARSSMSFTNASRHSPDVFPVLKRSLCSVQGKMASYPQIICNLSSFENVYIYIYSVNEPCNLQSTVYFPVIPLQQEFRSKVCECHGSYSPRTCFWLLWFRRILAAYICAPYANSHLDFSSNSNSSSNKTLLMSSTCSLSPFPPFFAPAAYEATDYPCQDYLKSLGRHP